MAESVSSDTIKFAGDVRIDDITIITANGFTNDITPQVVGLEIYEDIFSPFISGKVAIKDSQELTNLFPLIGEEFIRISVRTPGLPDSENFINREFAIYKMDDRMESKERESIFVLHFISKEAVSDLNKKLSKGYDGQIHEIVKKLYTDQDSLQTSKSVNIEETQNKTKFIANFWEPTKCLQYMADSAVDMQGNPAYVFFENKYGFHFVSLISLYTGTPLKQRFVKSNHSSDVGSNGGSAKDYDKDYQAIINLDAPEAFNYMERLKSGLYGSEIIYFDMLAQQYVHKGFVPEWDKKKSLNPFPLWTEKVTARTRAALIHGHQYFNAFENYGDVSNTKTVQERKHILAKAEGYKVTISVFGRMDYSAGQRVKLDIPIKTQIRENTTQDEVLDGLMSGYYLIGALCHFITREKHECTMELIKDSYVTELK